MTIKMRILIPMVIFTIVATAAVFTSTIVQFSNYVEVDIVNRLNVASSTALNRIDELKSLSSAYVSYLTEDTKLIEALEAGDRETLLERAFHVHDRSNRLYVGSELGFCIITDASGNILASPQNPESLGVDATTMSSVRSALLGDALTTIESGIGFQMSVCSAAPMYDSEGAFLGVAIAGYRLDTEDFVDYIKAVSNCEVTVCQNDVRISSTIMQNDGTRAVGSKAADYVSKIVLSGGIYMGRAQVLYHDMIMKYAPILGSDSEVVGMLAVGHYTFDEMDAIWSFVKASIVFTVVFITIIVLIILFIADHIVMPINEAADVLKEISKGNFESRVEGNYKGDLAVLKNSVNDTARELSHYMDKLIKAEHAAHESEIAKTRAEEISNIKSTFLANMSHEIRTPMNVIIGMAELMLAEDLGQRQRQYARDIKTSGVNLLNIINDILDMSKIESGKFEIVPVNYDFLSLIENIDSIFNYAAHSKNIEYLSERSGDIPKALYGDDIRLRQVLTNLLGNAVKFTPAGYVKLNIYATSDDVFFEVSDTGIGIMQEDIVKLFDPFQQVDTKANRSKTGAGLGLSISKSIVETMGGVLTVESDYGKGSNFRVRIPRIDGNLDEITTAVESCDFISAPEASVLVVDDFDINLVVTSGLLKLFGIECDIANSGLEAIVLASRKTYDLIFMDHMMPAMDGVETTRRLRDMGLDKENYPIIALTANAIEGVKEMLLSGGMNDFLSKPIDKSLLNEILIKWLPADKVRDANEYEESSNKESGGDYMSELRRIKAIDVDSGLTLTGGSEEIYLNTMMAVIKRIPTLIAGMTGFLEDGNLERFAIDIHGIKSSLASVGANGLSKQAFDMEIKAKDGDAKFCEVMFPEFSESILSLHKILTDIFFVTAQIPLRTGDYKNLEERIHEIRSCLEEFDDETALEILAFLVEFDFGGQANELLKTLNEQIEMFDYKNAENSLDCLERLL